MKKTHIFALVVIAIAVGLLIATAGDASSYVDFQTAKAMINSGNDNKVSVVGELKKNESDEIVGLQPSKDKLSFTFIMVDENQKEQKVFYREPMPADFVRSEKVVVIGNYKDDLFIADRILLKCPSKYEENQIKVE